MKFKYIGDKKKASAFGYNFSGSNAVDVPASDEHTIKKLTGNSYFKEVKTRKTAKA